MDLDNLQRATEVKGELDNINKQIGAAKRIKEKETGFVISVHRDNSGDSIDYMYKSGGYVPGVYEDIINFTIKRLEKYRDELIKEIESL